MPKHIADIDAGGTLIPAATNLQCLQNSAAIVRRGLIDGSIHRADRSIYPYVINENLPDAEIKGGLKALELGRTEEAKRLWSQAFADYSRFVYGTSHEEEGANLLKRRLFDEAYVWYYKFYTLGRIPNSRTDPLSFGPEGNVLDSIVGDPNLINGSFYGYLLKGLAAASLGHYSKATSLFQESLIENPYASDSWYFIGVTEFASGNFKGAKATWTHLIQIAIAAGGYPPDTGLVYEVSAAEVWYAQL